MTLLGLNKYLDQYDSQVVNDTGSILDLLKGFAFYNWQDSEDTNTFNHFIGLPQKNGLSYPLFDYEELLYNELQKHKHVWIMKATGLGITEFMLRYMTWLCLRDDSLKGSQMCIITGPERTWL